MRAMDEFGGKNKKTRIIKVEQDFLKEQEQLALENRRFLEERGLKMIDVMGSVGTGKTSLLEHLVNSWKDLYRIAVLNGDLTTSIDRERISRLGVSAVQINTGKECHLDAGLVRKGLEEIDLEAVDLIITENVGNLICPVDFPLGSNLRVLVISLTEGPYIALKHPHVFAQIEHIVINKVDLAPHLGVDLRQLTADIESVNEWARIYRLSCRTGEGLKELTTELRGALEGA